MNLHQLVLLKNSLLDSYTEHGIKNEIDKNIIKLNYVIPYSNEHYSEKIKKIASSHAEIFSAALENKNQVLSLIDEINQEIEVLTKKFFQDNYQTECFFNDVEALRRDKILIMADRSADVLLSRIHLYSSWKYPALEIGCRDGEWTKHLVTFDPLYIADDHAEFISSAVSQFTPEYQNRIRRYFIKDFIISGLPENQFSFIFSFNYFNYLSLDTIKQFLLQAMNWLRPGGVILFTYNNADLSASAGMCESYFMTYVPKSMLMPLAESLGYIIEKDYDFLPSTSWIELKKPGTLKTVKAHQSLGEIKYF